MVAQGTFDAEIKNQLRGRGNVNRGDAQQEARDRAARKLNVKSGKNKNPRTSTAMKVDKPKPKKAKSKGGGRKGVPIPGQRPSPMHPNSPDRTKDDPLTATPGAPVVDAPGMEGLITSLLLQRLIAQRGAGGAGPDMPADQKGIIPYEGPMNEVQLQRVPNDSDMPMLPPSTTPELTYNPQLALPPPQAPNAVAPVDTPDNFEINRFFNEGEIKRMQDAMPGITRMPGMPSAKPNVGNIHGPFPHGAIR